MKASSTRLQIHASHGHLPDQLPDIALQHGEALWVLANLGLGCCQQKYLLRVHQIPAKTGHPF